MAADYPGTIPTFTTKTDKVDLVEAAHINGLQNEVVAGLTELGTDVAGSAINLKTRLFVNTGNDGAVRQGTSFPGSPIEGQLFCRTDEKILYFFDGSVWRYIVLPQGTSFPGSPIEGQLFYRSDEKRPYIWDGSAWVAGFTETAYTLGDYVLAEYLSEFSQTTPAALTKQFELYIPRSGALRITWEMKVTSSVHTVTSKIYRNGNAVGVLKSNQSESYIAYSDDVSGWSGGDLCQMYMQSDESAGYIKNFRLLTGIPNIPAGVLP